MQNIYLISILCIIIVRYVIIHLHMKDRILHKGIIKNNLKYYLKRIF